MIQSVALRARRALLVGGLAALAASTPGCTDGETGSGPPVPVPTDAPAVATKGGPSARVPRGPGMAKALQDKAAAK